MPEWADRRTAVVAGGCGAIGLATAHRLAAKGFDIARCHAGTAATGDALRALRSSGLRGAASVAGRRLLAAPISG